MSEIKVFPGQVQVWWADLGLSEPEIDRLRGMLTPEELARADRFRIITAGRRFVAARAALRMILAQATGVEPTGIEFSIGSHGKPFLDDCELNFNASDSGDFVAVALATEDVGIDIECVRSLKRGASLAQRVCTEHELGVLESAPEDQRDALLLRFWTCKEAALKAVGTGLPGGMRNVGVEIPANGDPKIVRFVDQADRWTLAFPVLNSALMCSVVVRGSGWDAVSHHFPLQST
jgi:4'-phosphopantetheinyl transferase